MKKWLLLCLCLCLALSLPAAAEEAEVQILLSDGEITVNGQPVGEDASQPVYLAMEVQEHPDVPKELEGLANRVITITQGGVYRISGTALDAQIAVRAGEDDRVKLILDGVDLTCRTAPAIQGYTAYDPRVPGEYGLTIELAEGSDNKVTGSHTARREDEDEKQDAAIGSFVSLGFEGTGHLSVDADNEGVEVKKGHLTFNGGSFHIRAGDDPLNVSEDGTGVLTVNDGCLFSSVKPGEGGEGDGMDSNGSIVFNGGVSINLAHPDSADSGIDSDSGSVINGGVVVGAGNMYDPIDPDSEQLFMMLQFSEKTDSLVVVTDENDRPVFAYDFPGSYTYIVFSTPELTEGTYRVYLGGDIAGVETDGLYTDITSYTPGIRMQHGGAAAAPSEAGMPKPGEMKNPQPGGAPPALPEGERAMPNVDLNELLRDADLNEVLAGQDLNRLLSGFSLRELLTEEQLAELGDGAELETAEPGGNRGFGGPREMEASSDTATADFVLTGETTGFTNVAAVPSAR